MLNYLYRKYGTLKPVFIDGFLYVCIAIFGSIIGIMESDEVYKYMNAYAVFYIRAFSTVGLAAATALKMFRSTSYSEHQESKKADAEREGNTTLITKQIETNK